MYRNTYANIKLGNIEDNVKKIIQKVQKYKYYIGVVKADCYGHGVKNVVKSIIDGGCNYLAVSSLDEAMEIRANFDTPILCLGIINETFMSICEKNNIDITVTNAEYLDKIKDCKLNIHIKIDTGMNRLGIKTREELIKMMDIIKESNLKLKGIYTHIFNANNKERTELQLKYFKEITRDIDLSKIDMIHIAQSDTLLNYPEFDICNGCRLGIAMYGLTKNDLNLESTFELCSEIIEIKHLKKGDTVGYNGTYTARDNEIIGIVSIGYADGVNRKMTGSYVYVNDKKYQIIGNICMDMLMIKIDETVELKDKVYIFKNIEHIRYLSEHVETIPYELICNISKRVPRVCIE